MIVVVVPLIPKRIFPFWFGLITNWVHMTYLLYR
ncbi:hypothetical protein LARV_00463 [Longilinea arvoryzae]|uniref:Uncharacterized protein n=1 Tax=Longilinea arvoryzae TaxID=360412 RepID=A0A0S7B6Q5_9CHLR|nr:hypothetical protein LARV_00463 [Longilinea arvoryzae]